MTVMSEMSEKSWIAVCRTDAVPRNYGVAALLDGGMQVAIFRTDDDEFYALSNIDPISGAAVLSRGIVGDAAGTAVVASPVYKERFVLATGACLDAEDVRVATYAVRVTGDVVHVLSP